MKLKIPRVILENRVSQLVGFVNKRAENEVTNHIYIEGQPNGQVVLRATDTDIGLEVRISGEVVEPGSGTIDGRKFGNLLRATKTGEVVELSRGNGELEVAVGNYRFQLGSYNPEEFPAFPEVGEAKQLPLGVEQLVEGFKRVLHTIDTNSPKPELNCGLVDIRSDEVRLVGSDTRRLGLYRFPVGGEEGRFLIPRKGLLELSRVYTPEMELLLDDTFLIGKGEDTLFFSRLCGGKFPTYDPIIPTNFLHQFRLPKQELRDGLKPLLVFSPELLLRFQKDGVVIENQLSTGEGKGEVKIPIETNLTEEYAIGVNGKYLADFLGTIDGDSFWMGVQPDPSKPFLVWEGDYREVMMPLIF